jgi:hypothetical protein
MAEEGFNWDGETYTEGEGGAFIKEDAFNRLIYTDAIVSIIGIRSDDSATYEGKPKPQFLVDFIAPDGEEYTKGIAKGNPERDGRLLRFKATIEATGEPIDSTPFKVGKRNEFGPPKVN